MDFRLREPGIVEQSLQLFWCVGCHALHEVRPLGIGIDYLDHDGKTSTRLQYPVNALHTAQQIRPEIDRLDGRHKVERPFGWAQLVKSDFNILMIFFFYSVHSTFHTVHRCRSRALLRG